MGEKDTISTGIVTDSNRIDFEELGLGIFTDKNDVMTGVFMPIT